MVTGKECPVYSHVVCMADTVAQLLGLSFHRVRVLFYKQQTDPT